MRISHKSLFHKLRDTTVINRCEQYAKWTLPYLMADPVEMTGTGRVLVERDFQEVGAIFTNNLASKLARILFPTQYPFFRADASPEFKKHADTRGISPEELRTIFSRMEVASNARLFMNSGYAALIQALKYLIVTGQVLLYRDSSRGSVSCFGLQSFATRRDGNGQLLDCVLREYTCVEALPLELLKQLRAGNSSRYSRPEQSVEKYTRIHRDNRKGAMGYAVTVEIDTVPVGEPQWFPEKLCPWIVATWNLISGEHYARGMVEDYAGGFAKLSNASESAALYAVEMLRVLNLVSAGGGADVDELANADSGEWVRGDPSTVKAHESGDARKLEMVERQIETIVNRLSRAFMYTGGVRDAERVTAYELQRDAQEAEYALGGVYSTLSGGIQVPLAYLLLTEVNEHGLAGVIRGDLLPDVTAGIPALGRASDVQAVLLAGQDLANLVPLAQLDKRLDPTKIVDLVLAGRSIDPTTLFFSKEQQKLNAEAEAADKAAAQSMVAAQSMADQAAQINTALQTGA